MGQVPVGRGVSTPRAVDGSLMRLVGPESSEPMSTLVVRGADALPTPGAGQVTIQVVAAGVNRADISQRQGQYPPPPGVTSVLGLEVSGHVTALGEGVELWAVGDAVCALLSGGGYASAVTVDAGLLFPVPDGMPVDRAAALPEALCTVWNNLVRVAGITAGQRLLVHGGTSGVGSIALQVARELGVEPYATAGTEDKVQLCRELGAVGAVNYREHDFAEWLTDRTPGMDVILDVVGGSYLARNIACLAADGTLLTIGRLGGDVGELDVRQLIRRRLTVTGTSLRSLPLEDRTRIVSAVQERLWWALDAGRIAPVIDASFPLDHAEEAHQLLLSGEVSGKLLLLP